MAPKNTENRLKRVEALLSIDRDEILSDFGITKSRVDKIKGQKDTKTNKNYSPSEAEDLLLGALGETVPEEED